MLKVDSIPATEVLAALPVFPLPNVVLFPDQQLPLHIFEPRYRQLVRDILDGPPYVVIARITGDAGVEPSHFAHICTVGRLAAHQRLSDGRFNILLEGAVRVEATEVESDRLYRRVRCDAIAEPYGESSIVPASERSAMLSLLSLVLQASRAKEPGLEFTPPAGLDAARLAYRIADRFFSDGATRQLVLEAPDARARVARVTEGLAQRLGDLGPPAPRARGAN